MGDRADRVGRQVGDYRLLRWLGGGGFGDVYLGEHIHKQTQAAVKILQVRLTRREELREFINEARIMRLQHPHIISMLDFGIGNDDVPFLVMAYAPNGTLRDRHPKGSRLPLSTIVSYVRPIASALYYAHSLRLIHRDVKPENMLVGSQQEVLLSDFGIATIAQSTRSLSTEQGIGGTVPYMAPEQIQGKPRPASDQYALGIVVYEWITGRWPFEGTSVEIAMQHAMTPPPPLREQLPTLPMAVEQVVLTALRKDPKQRFADIEEFAEALKEASQRADMSRQAPEHSLSNGLSLPHDPTLARHSMDKVDVVDAEATKSMREPVFPVTPSEVVEAPPVMQPVDGPLPLPIVTTPAFTLSKQEQPSPYPPTTWTFQSQRRKRLSRRTAVLLLILVVLILGGGGGLYMSVSHFTSQMQARARQPTFTPSTPTKTSTTTSMPGGVDVLAKDSFQRTAQTFWGTASDGRLWQGDANTVEVFSIKGGAGQIDHGQGAFNAVLGPVSANAEVIFTSTVNHFTNGTVNIGAVLRWVDGNNWYKALIDGAHLQLLSRINGTTKSLATMPFPAQDGISYTLRFRVVGANLFAKVWPANQPEPAAWMLTVTDTGLAQGMGGIRVLLQNASVIRVTSFLETTTGNI